MTTYGLPLNYLNEASKEQTFKIKSTYLPNIVVSKLSAPFVRFFTRIYDTLSGILGIHLVKLSPEF
jgi:hypothetical protein